MAKGRKAHAKTKRKGAGRRAPPRKKTTQRRNAAAAPKPRQAPDPLDALLESAAAALALPIEAEWRAAIKANLAVNLEMASFVAAFALPDEAEPAPIFRA
jgi:Protein of unknown function (DUF4089)